MTWEQPNQVEGTSPPPLPGAVTDWRFMQRPGSITTVSVLSIVFGSIGILVSGIALFYAIVFAFLMPAIAAGGSVRTTGTSTTYINGMTISSSSSTSSSGDENASPIVVGSRGFDVDARAAVMKALRRMTALDKAQSRQMNRLLAKAGKDLFPGGADRSSQLEKQINESGTTSSGAVYFVIGTGRIDLDDQHATFTPSSSVEPDHGVVTVGQGATEAEDDEAATTDAAAAPMRFPTYPGNPAAPATQASAVKAGPVSMATAGTFVIAGEALSALLGLMLLIAGIMTIRNNRIGRTMHLAYVALKFLVAILCGIGWSWLMLGFFATVTAQTPGAGANVAPADQLVYLFSMLFSLVPCVYAMVILIIFMLKQTRDYYAAITATAN